MIDDYSFGRIVIDGCEYQSDVMIYPDGPVQDSWWRSRGHSLTFDDIRVLIDAGPELIVAGTGASGMMRPDKKLRGQLAKCQIEFEAAPSRNAMDLYNRLKSHKKIAACFHLTC